MRINVFLPCKKNSTRVKNKNKRRFAKADNSLIKIKLNQLLKAKLIDKIYLSTNDTQIIKLAKKINNKKIIIHKRIDTSLSQNNTVTQKLIKHAMTIIPDGHILWTHVTSPFVDSKMYDKVIRKYKNIMRSSFDSLMTVTKIKGFVWDEKKSLNYNYKKTKWPRTQEIKSLNKINSAIFLSSKSNYLKFNDRIGNRPYMFQLPRFLGVDIDDIEDFYLAEFLFKNKNYYN